MRRSSRACQISSIGTMPRSSAFRLRRSIFSRASSWSLSDGCCRGASFAREAAFERSADRLAPRAEIRKQPLRSCAAFVAHPAGEGAQRFAIGRQRPCRLIALDAQAIFQPRDEFETVAQGRSLEIIDEMELLDRAQQFASGTFSQRRMPIAVRKRHHLRDELHIDQSAASLLQVKTRVTLDADLFFHSGPHLRDLSDLGRRHAPPEDELLARGFNGDAERIIAGYHATAHQRLTLPHRRALAMVVAEALDRGDERSLIS